MTALLYLPAIVALTVSLTMPATSADSIEGVIDAEFAASGVPGLSYSVVEDGEIISAGAQGVARLGDDTEVTPDTPFLTGSISKSFTAMGVMQLVEAELIDLDAPLARYLEAFEGQPAGEISIRQLLTHTSGFSTLQGNASHTDATAAADELARRVTALAAVEPAYAPGVRWEYSNTNYEILGRLIEVVSGRDFQAYITDKVLEPVGMNDSFVADGAVHESMATGHRPWFWVKIPLATAPLDRGTAPQGGIVASANDLARYLAVMMNGEDDILSATGKAMMMSPGGDVSPFYGFGWFVDTENGTVSHSGTSQGFESLATMIPTENKAVVVLVNGGSGMAFGDTAQLRNGITDAALGLHTATGGPGWSQQLLFLGLVLLPVAYLLSMLWAWLRRGKLRAKTSAGLSGTFSLWFPLLTTLVAAWVVLYLVPTLIGSPIGSLSLFQPDLGFLLVASAITGVVWALFRLGVAYLGRRGRPEPRA